MHPPNQTSSFILSTLAVSVVALASLSAHATGNADQGLNIFPPLNLQAPIMVDPVSLDAFIPYMPPDCAPGEFMDHQINHYSEDLGNGNTTSSEVHVFTCEASGTRDPTEVTVVIPECISNCNNDPGDPDPPQHNEALHRWNMAGTYDGTTTELIYAHFIDDHLVHTHTVRYESEPPQEVLGPNSQLGASLYTAWTETLPHTDDRSPYYTPPITGGSDDGDGGGIGGIGGDYGGGGGDYEDGFMW